MENLAFVICCEYCVYHDWMSFASWYSLSKHFPDAKVVIAIKRSFPYKDLFKWPIKCDVKMRYYSKDMPSNLINDKIHHINPTVVAVRDYDCDLLGPVSVKSDIMPTLVDYSEGCGSFVLSEWINKMNTPFRRAVKMFATKDITANEIAVLRLWEKVHSLYNPMRL